jgi:diaminohydroxyphosphoribosylaminopyrimidine deaminase/5-amino-6-(5-phosphoribosylamino)uracil reductase
MTAPPLDERWMRVALDAARTADYRTSPNPMVGAVVVRDDTVVGSGYHARAGSPHAEVIALEAAGDAAHGATLYVTLEPCSHEGRTPPCAPLVVSSGIARVVVAIEDPNPRVAGRGLTLLRSAGLDVSVGVLGDEASRLVEFWSRWIVSGRPFVTAKFAMSLDGRIATHDGESRWITSDESRAWTHRLRHAHDAILVGANTVVRDDPNLTTRLPEGGGRQPLRIVLDSRLRVTPSARIFRQEGEAAQAGVLVATSDRARERRVAEMRDAGIDVEVFPSVDGRVSLPALLDHLGAREKISLLIEGGSTVHGAAFDGGLVDRVVAFIAPRVIGGVESPAAVGGHGVARLTDALPLRDVEVERAGGDIVVSGYCSRQASPSEV